MCRVEERNGEERLRELALQALITCVVFLEPRRRRGDDVRRSASIQALRSGAGSDVALKDTTGLEHHERFLPASVKAASVRSPRNCEAMWSTPTASGYATNSFEGGCHMRSLKRAPQTTAGTSSKLWKPHHTTRR